MLIGSGIEDRSEGSWRYVFLIVGFAVMMLFGGSALHTLFTNVDEFGTTTTRYHCPHCHVEIALSKIPADRGILFTCPKCGSRIRS